MGKIQILTIALLLLSSGCVKTPDAVSVNSTNQSGWEKGSMLIDGRNIAVDIARSPLQQAQGLSGRAKLSDDEGMLFDLTQSNNKRPGFWMKDMDFGLDIIWIRNGKIIGIAKDVPAPINEAAELAQYHPPSEVDYVLEVNAGWSDRYGIRENETAQLNEK
jgi:uncharacterized protein